MCLFSAPKIPAPPTPASFQPTQTPKDMTQGGKSTKDALRRRGLYASIFTGPQGIAAAPMTTGTTGGSTGTTGG
jgi:hypothetical protein